MPPQAPSCHCPLAASVDEREEETRLRSCHHRHKLPLLAARKKVTEKRCPSSITAGCSASCCCLRRKEKEAAVEEKLGEKNDESCTSSSSSESDSSEDEKGLLCLFSQEDSEEELCLMADEEEVTSQNHSSNYSSESTYHENPREAFERMMKSFDGIEDSHLKLKEENAKLLAERQDLEDLRSAFSFQFFSFFFFEQRLPRATTFAPSAGLPPSHSHRPTHLHRRSSTAARPPRFANAPPPSFATAHIRFASAAPPSHRRHAQPPQPCPATTAPPSQRRLAQPAPVRPATALPSHRRFSSLLFKIYAEDIDRMGRPGSDLPSGVGVQASKSCCPENNDRHIGEEADLVVIKNAGHVVNLEKTNEFAKHLKAFLYESLSD
nr:monoacylglycerol lipase ABHD6 [Ipomoea trifida]